MEREWYRGGKNIRKENGMKMIKIYGREWYGGGKNIRKENVMEEELLWSMKASY